MKMKKILAIILAAVCMATFCGFAFGEETVAEEAAEKATVGSLLDSGYMYTMHGTENNVWSAIFQKDFSMEKLYRVKVPLTEELANEFMEMPFDEEETEARRQEVIRGIPEAVVDDVTNLLPTREYLDQFIGKTLGDLEEAGFESSGYTNEETETVMFYDSDLYCLKATLKDVITDMDDYSVNALRKMEIARVECYAFNFGIMDEPLE